MAAVCPPIRVKVVSSVEELITQVREKALQEGIDFEGDGRSGRFNGPVSGTYVMEGNEVVISVAKKPFFISCEWIRSQIESFFDPHPER